MDATVVAVVDSETDAAVPAGTELEEVTETAAGPAGAFAAESPEPHALKSRPSATADPSVSVRNGRKLSPE